MSKRSYFCGGSVLAFVIGLSAVQAQAQTAPTKAAASADVTTLSDLIVTAERREERLQSVPVAVTAFSAIERTTLGIESVQDLTNFTPGFSYNANSDRPYMRGIGRNTDNLAVASAVATYYNGVYDGANATILLQHSDLFINTIEVDRGPQNTLHGANADGGSINYVSQKPTKDFYAEARAGVGNNDRYWGEAVVSGPITDNLRFRLGGNYTSENGGYFKNLDGPSQGGGLPQLSAGHSQYIEGQFDANLGEHLDAWGMISSGTFEGDYHQIATQGSIPNNFQLNGGFSPNSFYALCGLPGAASAPGGTNGCSGAASAGQIIVPGSVGGGPVFANAFPGNDPTNLNTRDFIQEATSTNKMRADLALATNWTYHAPGVDITYLGGYQKFNYVLNFTNYADSGVTNFQTAGASSPGICFADAAGGGYSPTLCSQPLTILPEPSTTFFQENDAFYSHEIDLTSTNDSPLQWIAGGYYYHEHYDQPVSAGVQPNQTQFAHPFFINAATGAITPAPANPMSAVSVSDTKLDYTSWALFGHFDYKFNDAWKAHIGIRYTDDHKYGEQFWRFEEFDVIGGFQSSGVPGSPIFTGFGAATPALDVTAAATAAALGTSFPGAGPASINPVTGFAQRNLDAKWNAWTGDAGVDWTPDQDTLLYGKYSRGYKAGGFSTFTLAPNPETGLETVDAFEAGVKKTFNKTFRVNAATFYDDYSNDQIPLNVQNSAGLISSQLFNLKSVHIWGVELEGLWQPTDELTLGAQYAHLDAKVNNPGACFEDTVDPLALLPGASTAGCNNAVGATAVTQNLKGQQLPEAPPNKVSANATYVWTFDPGKLSLSGTYVWKDATYGGLFNRAYDLAPAYTQVNFRAVWTDQKDRYNVIAYVNNAFNTQGFDGRTGALLEPGFITSNYSLLNPRTYGLEFRVRFH